MWAKNNNGQNEDKLKPLTDSTFGDCVDIEDKDKVQCTIEGDGWTAFTKDDGDATLFKAGDTMCFYLKAYNANSNCNWDDSDEAKKATSLKQGSVWSADYTKDSKSNCITWLECPEYETPTTATVVRDDDLTNWFELWIKWAYPDQEGGAEVSYYEIIYYKKDEKWDDGADVDCAHYDDPAEFTDDRKKENKLHKLTSTS